MKKKIITWTLAFAVCSFTFFGSGDMDFATSKAKKFSATKLNVTLLSDDSDKGVAENGYTSENVKISANAVNRIQSVTKTIFKDGLPIKWRYEVSDEGEYRIEIIDKNVNVYSREFSIDRSSPKIVVKEGKNVVDSGSVVSGPVAVQIYDKSPVVKTVRLNGKRIQMPLSGIFFEKGTYVVTATDYADNASTFRFRIK